MARRVIMHLDLDYFYAQCEENRNPELRGKPVIVCVYSGRTTDSGVVSTSNYESRRAGIRAGMPIVRAKKLLEGQEAKFLPMDRPYYEDVSQRVMEIIRTYADPFEEVGIDEAFLDMTSRTRSNYEAARSIALEIKTQIRTDEQLSSSIGVAPNKLVAKIASDHQKPDGLTVVKPEDVKGFLWKMNVGKIPGVGKKVEEKLSEINVTTVEQLSKIQPSLLIDYFGKNLGGYLYGAARGEDDEPVKDREQPTQFSRIATLKQDSSELNMIFPLLDELAGSVAEKLKQNGMKCKSVGIIAILLDLSIHSKTRTLDKATDDVTVIRYSSRMLIENFLKTTPAATLRRFGIKVSNLNKETGQMDISKFITANK